MHTSLQARCLTNAASFGQIVRATFRSARRIPITTLGLNSPFSFGQSHRPTASDSNRFDHERRV